MNVYRTPELININDYKWNNQLNLPSNTLRIDRAGKWGNPFIISVKRLREEVIKLHKEWFLNGEGSHLKDDIMELLDYDFVACWCDPQPCHWINYWDYLIEKLHERDMIDEC